jgi:hypothetical protein
MQIHQLFGMVPHSNTEDTAPSNHGYRTQIGRAHFAIGFEAEVYLDSQVNYRASRCRAAPGSRFVAVLGTSCVSRSVSRQLRAARSLSSIFGGIMVFVAVTPEIRALRPNPSVKPTRNSRPHRPRGAHAHVAPRGRHALLSHAAYLKR